MNTVEVKLFGIFRKYVPCGIVQVSIERPSQIPEFKKHVLNRLKELSSDFSDQNLILESALANEDEILSEDHLVKGGEKLAFLPPVCGG